MKIAILGYSACGKSTLAKRLAAHYGAPLLHLDAVYFTAGWQARDHEEALKTVADFLRQDSWVVDGNYAGLLMGARVEQADQLIYLAFPRLVCLHRAFKRRREFRYAVRDSIAEGCEEKIDAEFVWWILHKGRSLKKRRYFSELFRPHQGKLVYIRSQRQLDRFLASLIQ